MSLEDSVQRALTEHARDVSAEPDVAALVARGTQARRRRRLAVAVSIAAAVVGGAIVAGPLLSNTAEPPPVVATPAAPSSSGTTTAGASPRTGTGFFAGSANVPVRFTLPPGWEMLETLAVVKTGADPVFGAAFYDVANIYADGCRWVLVDPPVGAGVDDLVTAYQNLPELRPTPARDITVDGYKGKQLQFTVPDYTDDNCQEATYALAQADNAGTNTGQTGPPNYWAQGPNQTTTAIILDVGGSRLVIYASYPPDISARDRADLDTILDSLRIG